MNRWTSCCQPGNGWIAAGAIMAGLAVGFGAFGAHGLQTHIQNLAETDPALATRRLANWNTAAQYQMYHALAMIAVGLLQVSSPQRHRLAGLAAFAFLIGTIIFSGSLYALVLSEFRVLGAIVPLGGTCFIIGWLLLAYNTIGPDRPAPVELGDSE